MSQELRFAAIQLESSDDVAANLRSVRRWVHAAAGAGARAILLPENFAFFGEETAKVAHAERLGDGGPIQETLCELAAEHGAHIVGGGFPECSDDSARPYNTALVVAPGGSLRASYRKAHLFDVDLGRAGGYLESAGTTPGAEPVVVNIDGFRVGLTICYDLRFSALYASLFDAGAEVFCVPAAFTQTTGEAHWNVLLRARAIEFQSYVVAAGQCGEHPGGRSTFGHSAVIDPWGTVLSETVEGEGYISGVLERSRIESVRQGMPVAQHRKSLCPVRCID